MKSFTFAARLRGITQLGYVFITLRWSRTCTYLCSSNWSP